LTRITKPEAVVFDTVSAFAANTRETCEALFWMHEDLFVPDAQLLEVCVDRRGHPLVAGRARPIHLVLWHCFLGSIDQVERKLGLQIKGFSGIRDCIFFVSLGF